jgi:flagellar protein FliL
MGSEGKKEKNFNLIIIILLVVIVVGLLGLAAGFYFFNVKGKSLAKVSDSTTKSSTTMDSKKVSTLTFPLVGEFLLNLSDEGGNNHIKAKISVGYDNKKLTAEITTKTPIIRDAIISVLRSKKTSDFKLEKDIDNIKKELLTRINLVLSAGQANNIYFDDILIQ